MRNPTPWDDVFMEMAHVIAKRSKDPSTQVGAVIVDHSNRIVSLGFNGPPRGIVDSAVNWKESAEKWRWVVHAEENAWLHGLEARGNVRLCTLYSTAVICPGCALRAVHLGIDRFVCANVLPRSADSDYLPRVQAIMSASGAKLLIR